ncbi:MAG: type II secretion system protein N [Pseudomonadales bacterium]
MLQIKSIIAEKPRVVVGMASALLGAIFIAHASAFWWPAKPQMQNLRETGSRALEFDIERIVSNPVFAGSQSSVPSSQTSDARTAALVNHSEFSLQAIFESSDESRSTVIIARSGQPPRSYSVGDVLTDGISISGIDRDRVNLVSHGQPAVLKFKQQARTPANAIQRVADKFLGQMSDEGKLGQVKQRLEQLRRQSQEQ